MLLIVERNQDDSWERRGLRSYVTGRIHRRKVATDAY